MNIVFSGNLTEAQKQVYRAQGTVHSVLRPGYTLCIGSHCNDGRPITESWHYKQAKRMGIPILSYSESISHPIKPRITKEPFVTKYAPKTVSDIIGHKEAIQQIGSWLQSWNKGYPDVRGILITGPPGIGKTSTVHCIIKAMGYKVVEYNASDTRSISTLRGMIALGIRRLQKEVIVMDEVDGLSERGGVGEIAAILKKTVTPIICIANEKPPKLRPIINVCIDIKFQRPMKSSIATALLKVVKAEKITISKVELEELCERNGNDIRSILNQLEFYGQETTAGDGNKDAILRMDLFSATQKLFSNKSSTLDEAEQLVFVDYHMIPLMVQEGYLAASQSIEEARKASEWLSFGDTIEKRIHCSQEWDLIPDFVQCSIATTKTVSGKAPFQLFPQWLGKNSKGLKHSRYMKELADKMRCNVNTLRLDYVDSLQTILLTTLTNEKPDIKGLITQLDEMGWTRDDVMENLQEVCLDPLEIPTKVKTAFTREYNKVHKGVSKKRNATNSTESDGEEEEDDIEEIREGIEELEV